jgi:MFS family permease
MSRRQGQAFHRDRLTWVAYVMLAWFAYMQAAPGLVIGYLRAELGVSYTSGGLHVAAFAAGSMVSGLVSARLERIGGRRVMWWSAPVVMGCGVAGLTAADQAAATVGSALVLGVGGGLLLVTIQATLADHHGVLRAVALAEANVAASLGYVGLIGALSLTSALHASWRIALLAALVVPIVTCGTNRRLDIEAAPPPDETKGSLPGVFWIAAAMLFCTTAAEWCVTAWGASFVEQAVDVRTDDAVAVMTGYFGGVVAGRTLGSRLARRHDPASLLAAAFAVNAIGFVIVWPATTSTQALIGLTVLGIGLGNLFPMAVSLAVALVPERAMAASGRAVAAASFAGLLTPITIGTLADTASLKIAFGIVPVTLGLAAAALAVIRHARRAGRSRMSDDEGWVGLVGAGDGAGEVGA